jgi:hypothetical protein
VDISASLRSVPMQLIGAHASLLAALGSCRVHEGGDRRVVNVVSCAHGRDWHGADASCAGSTRHFHVLKDFAPPNASFDLCGDRDACHDIASRAS